MAWLTSGGTNLRGGDLYWAVSFEINLKGADLSGARLNGATLRGADLRDAILVDADLSPNNIESRTQLQGADLTGADVTGANCREAQYDGETRFPAGFDPAAQGLVFGPKGS